MMQTSSKLGNKRQRKAYSNYAPLERTVIRTWSVTNKQKLETKAEKHRPIKDNAYRQDLVSVYTENGVNYCVNNNHA